MFTDTYLYLLYIWVLNPIPAGVLENQDMTNETSLKSSCALLLESAKKLANLQKLIFLSQNPVI